MNVAWNMGIPWQDGDTKDLDALTFRRCIEMATIDGGRALGLGVDGRILKRHGELVAFDVGRVVRDAEQASHAVRARAGGRLQPAP